jgi:hypothetical protein
VKVVPYKVTEQLIVEKPIIVERYTEKPIEKVVV